ncbi:hypothetical protein ELH73_22240 [Rhizobium leguminosarum]|nr:hypothetical protein ELI28_22260 [Rhizobium leguminosarum]TAV80685.1 hypothetical protein ELI27_22245 [Rhizobium leguminosarum]TAX41717.1 hypothetical protein ELI05_23420 [Rhizobium leguminosarum]TAX94537.1 hypothetical protein ELH97_22425 [Rhizobium leguminosarum]TAX99078.1 hypothetical protein ELH94_22365 [Rhizobium leguminosarum]
MLADRRQIDRKSFDLHVILLPSLRRRASLQTPKGRCSTLNCCIILSSNRFRLKDKIMQQPVLQLTPWTASTCFMRAVASSGSARTRALSARR